MNTGQYTEHTDGQQCNPLLMHELSEKYIFVDVSIIFAMNTVIGIYYKLAKLLFSFKTFYCHISGTQEGCV